MLLDAGCTLWKGKFDESGSEPLTFRAPTGYNKFHPTPLGISSAPQVFQRLIAQISEELLML